MNSTKQRSNCRSGIAQFEFLMALPFLMGLFCVIFPIASASLTRMENSKLARNSAFEGRHKPWLGGDYQLSSINNNTQAISAVLGPNPLVRPERSLIESESESEVDPIMSFYSKLVEGKTSDTGHVLGGSWDHQENEFKEHDRLVLPEQATYFGLSAGTRRQLEELAAFPGEAHDTSLGETVIANGQRAAADAIRQLQREYSRLNWDDDASRMREILRMIRDLRRARDLMSIAPPEKPN